MDAPTRQVYVDDDTSTATSAVCARSSRATDDDFDMIETLYGVGIGSRNVTPARYPESVISHRKR